MVIYWNNQHLFDVISAFLLAVFSVFAPKLGAPVLMTITNEGLVLSARAWVGPALTLLGMMSATTAFIFSVIEKSEFSALKAIGVEAQLWKVFSENILWMAIAAISAMFISFIGLRVLPDIILIGVLFIFYMIVICLLKFSWVMRQIISVRASR